MSDFRIGGLFEGYGGLTMGVQLALAGGELAWYSEHEPATEKNPRPSQAPARLLAHRHPGVPNLGDITAVDWSRVEPVDVLCGGSPCQDVSAAGRRAGMRPGTRSGLWESMREAIATLRPRLVVWENVRGVTSACAHSELADCPRCVGGSGPHVPVLRALGRVLGDLADLGFDAEWHGLPASAVGAPHERWREFVCAWPADSDITGWWQSLSAAGRRGEAQGEGQGRDAGRGDSGVAADAERGGRNGRPQAPVGRPIGRAATAGTRADSPTDASGDGWDEGRPESARFVGRSDASLGGAGLVADSAEFGCWSEGRHDGVRIEGLEQVAVADADCDELARQWTQRPGRAVAAGSGCGVGCQRDRDWRVWRVDRWVDYGPAIRRWHDLTRCVPSPVEQGSRGGWRLAPAFSEWMQGLPEGHVTDPAIGISRNDQLKLIGNGVIPQHSAAAVRVCLWRAVALDGAA